ncbi:MAG: acetylglutamate kinase [Microthrixaceae bacterium]
MTLPDLQHHRVEVLLEALPYIQRFRGAVVVVKFGGNAMTSPELFDRFASDIALMHSVGMRPVVVHGGGPQIGEWLGRMGKESAFVDGHRVTDAETLEIVTMVLLGKVNSAVVSAINVHGPIAVGLSGQDAGLIVAAERHPDLGFVGDVSDVNPEIVQRLVSMDMVPVVATVGTGEGGQAYNINADAVAGAIAQSISADKLVFLTDVAGVLRDVDDPDSLIASLTMAQASMLVTDGVVAGGMIPKIEGCMRALDNGVREVHLVDGRVPHAVLLELFSDAGVGTLITRA